MRFNTHPVTPAHMTAFGAILVTMSQIDAALDNMIMALIGGKEILTLPLLTMLGTKDKGDYLSAMSKETWLTEAALNELDGLLARVKSAAALRNTVAHSVWKAGRRKDAIKPMTLSARTVVKMKGTDHNEKEWTAEELKKQAQGNEALAKELYQFAFSQGLVPSIARTILTNKGPSSESNNG